MKIDLHVHCRERSLCARASEVEQIRAAIAAGLDGLAFTDHDRLVPAAHLEELNRQFAPFRVFGGVEVTLVDEHIVVLGIQDPALESRAWDYPTLWQFVRQQGGFMALAHPFRWGDTIASPIESLPPDAIEVYSQNTPSRCEARIRQIADRLGLRLLANSDAHITSHLGRYYNQLELDPGGGTGQLLAQLKKSLLIRPDLAII